MPRASKKTNAPKEIVNITTISDASGVPLDGSVLDGGGLEAAVQASVAKMDWLTDSDHAMVELALEYARQIDSARETARIAVEHYREDPSDPLRDPSGALGAASKALYLGPHLHNALKALGGAPLERKQISGEAAAVPVSPLQAMRDKARGA